MADKKSHVRIHQVILQRREKAKLQKSSSIDTASSKQLLAPSVSATYCMKNSQFLPQTQASSLVLPRSNHLTNQLKNSFKIPNFIVSSYHNAQKIEDQHLKRQIKSARPVSRKKITSKDKFTKNQNQKDQIVKISDKKSQIFQTLQILEPQFFIIQKEDNQYDMQNEIKSLQAFWVKQHNFVGLFPLEYTEFCIYNHPNILPVYGQVILKEKRFVVSNQYKHSSLKDLLKQFGAFQEKLCKIYLYQILSGLEEMHIRKMAHNRLSTESILYDKEGNIIINVIKSTSRPLTEKQKQEKMFLYCPQILLTKSKSNSIKSDIWSIGILLLDMLFNFEVLEPKYMFFHPYNYSEKQFRSDDAIIVDNLKQLYPKSFENGDQAVIEKQIMQKYKKLTDQCKDLIYKCLMLNKDERISLKSVKQHFFFHN